MSLSIGAKVTLVVAALSVGAITTVAVRATQAPPTSAPTMKKATEPIVEPAPAPAPLAAVQEPTPEAPPIATVEVDVPSVPEPVVPKPATKRPAPVAPLTAEPVPPLVAEPEPEVATPPSAPTLATAQTQSDFATLVELQFPSCDAAVEARTATAARSLLTEDRAQHALLLLSEYQRQCVSGQWSDEAWRVRLSSLCKLNRNKEAATLFEWFASEYPKRREAIESELRVNCAASVLGR